MTTTTARTDLLALAQRLQDASAAGDFDTVLAGYHPDVVWINDVGAGPWAGRIEGIDAVTQMFAGFLARFDGTFTQEVVDLCASDDRAISVLVERGTIGEHAFENRAVWVNRFVDGLIVEVWTLDLDREAGAAFWAAVDAA